MTLDYLCVHMLVYNEILLFSMHSMNIKVTTMHVCLLTHCLGHLSR